MRWGCGGCFLLAVWVLLAGLGTRSAEGRLVCTGLGSLAACFILPFLLVSGKGMFRGWFWLIGLLITGAASLANVYVIHQAQTNDIAGPLLPFGAFLIGSALAALLFGEESK